MQRSGRNNACPSCGRVKDKDCAWTDDVLFCHQGSSCGPDPALKIGDTITIDGQRWALVKTNAGYSGSAHVFKPHEDREPVTAANREQILDQRARRAIAAVSLERFFTAHDRAWNVADFHSLNPHQLQEAIHTINGAYDIGKELARSAQSIWREHHDLRDTYHDRFNAYITSIGHQYNDLRHFRSFYLGEVV